MLHFADSFSTGMQVGPFLTLVWLC